MNTPDPVPAPPAPVTAGALPWLQSTDQKRRLVTGVLMVAVYFAPRYKILHELGLDDQTKVTGYVAMLADFIADFSPILIGLGGMALGAYQRARSKLQPLTWTKAAAASHPATIALVETQRRMEEKEIPTAVTLQQQIEAEQKILKL